MCPFSPVFRSMTYIFRLQISCSSTKLLIILVNSFYADIILEVKFAVLWKNMTRKMSTQKFVFSNFHSFQNWFAFNLKQFHKYVTQISDSITYHYSRHPHLNSHLMMKKATNQNRLVSIKVVLCTVNVVLTS